MGIKETADSLVEKGKSVLDINQDGQVDTQEVVDTVVNRVKETAEAAGIALGEVKEGFDADGDGAVSIDEVKAVADGIAGKAKDVISSLLGKQDAPAEAVAEEVAAEEPVAEEAAAEEPVAEEAVEPDAVEDAPQE